MLLILEKGPRKITKVRHISELALIESLIVTNPYN